MDFGEKGVNTETGCISNEELERRERKYGRSGMSEESIQKIRDIDEKNFGQKIQFTPHTEPTLRDSFAMAALTGLLASCDGPAWGRESFPLGETCYAYADQLLEARKK